LKQTVRVTSLALFVAFLFGVKQASGVRQTAAPTQAGVEFFEKKIRPVLTESCYGCHSAQAKKPQGGLRLDSRDAMLKGGASGQAAVVPGDPDRSLLIRAIRYTDAKLQMPYAGKLPDHVIKDFEEWVRVGAPDPRTAAPAAAANWSPYDFNEAKRFWSFRPVRDRQPPRVKSAAWARTPVDNFILAKLEEKSLKPAADADRLTLLRRATFDLTGLPPTPREVDEFLSDKSPNAFEKVVDRLLAGPAYGEKWGRHWLDLVRYADTAGDNSDFPVPSAYKYRDYVIKSFNEDKPYDRFIKEQIAGDILAGHRGLRVDGKLPDEEEDEVEIPGAAKMSPQEAEKAKHEKIIATGYLALSRRFGSRNREFNLTIDDTIDNVGKAFLGLSTSCARCHDHKFDPIPQQDYYALYGIFNSSRYAFPGQEIYPRPADFVALAPDKEAERFYKYQRELSEIDDRIEFLKVERGVAARNKKLKEAQAKQAAQGGETGAPDAKIKNNETGTAAKNDAKDAAKDAAKNDADEHARRPADYDRDSNNSAQAQKSTRLPEEVDAEMVRVRARLAELHERPVRVEKAFAVVEGFAQNARVHRKGDPKNLGDEVPRGFLTILGGQKLPAGYKGSGRELLADWIADEQNPLTARVMVNRIWQYHFGKGLVKTPNDFGARGEKPTHPELLDYLAARFIEGGWSVKKMHRLLMLSHTYQLSSADDALSAGVDVANTWLWRFNKRRLAAEEIRDAMLAVSGALDRTPGGEHPFPPEKDWRFSQHKPFVAAYEHNRRSVYLMQQRIRPHPQLSIFDGADTNAATAERTPSTTPLQALFMMNSPFVHEQADHFAVRVGMAYADDAKRIDYAYRLAFGRAPSPTEIRKGLEYLRNLRPALTAIKVEAEAQTRAALASYLRVLLSSSEFVFVD
jgi:cytochrome c553